MAKWSDLKATIAQIVKTNGNQEITGQLLQNVLNNIVSSVGENSTFAGIATPATSPGVPDGNVFYLATEAGIYANFNGVEITTGEAVILEWRGSWVKKDTGFATEQKTILSSNNMPIYQGSIFLGGNILNNTPNTTIKNRCYSKVFKTQDVKLLITDGYNAKLIYADNQYNSVGGVIERATEISTQYPYGILVVAKNDNADFTPDDVKIIVINKALNEEVQALNEEVQALNEEVQTLNEEVQTITDEIGGIILWEKENSSIFVTDGSFITASNRRRTKFNAVNNVDKIVFPNTPMYYIVYYDNEKSWISSDGWKYDKEYSITENKPLSSEYFIILIDTTQTDYKDIFFNTEFGFRIEKLEEQTGKNTEDIQTLKSGVGSNKFLVLVEWEIGGINSADGSAIGSLETRRRTKDFLPISYNEIKPNVTADAVIQIMFYGADNIFISTYMSTYGFANVTENTSILIDSIKPENALTYKINMKYPDIEPGNLEFYQNASGIFKEIEDIKEKISKVYNFENLLIVDEKGNGDYTTIEDALKNANDTDENHVVILVMPGTYYPAPKKSSSDMPYAENNRNISILGIDKNSCILKGNVGYYYYQINVDYALLRLNGNVTIGNLTLDNRSDLYEQTATENGWDLSSPHCRAYCVHVDGNGQENSILEIVNCSMYNDHFTCVGFGTRPNSTLKIIDCDAISDVNAEKNALSEFKNYGTLYGHLGSNSTEPNQKLEITRCKIINTNYETAINLMDAAGEGAEGNVVLIQNACATTNNENAFKKADKFIIDRLSSGNNITNMNYQ